MAGRSEKQRIEPNGRPQVDASLVSINGQVRLFTCRDLLSSGLDETMMSLSACEDKRDDQDYDGDDDDEERNKTFHLLM